MYYKGKKVVVRQEGREEVMGVVEDIEESMEDGHLVCVRTEQGVIHVPPGNLVEHLED